MVVVDSLVVVVSSVMVVVVVVSPSKQWLIVNTLALSIQCMPNWHGRLLIPLSSQICLSLKALDGDISGVV